MLSGRYFQHGKHYLYFPCFRGIGDLVLIPVSKSSLQCLRGLVLNIISEFINKSHNMPSEFSRYICMVLRFTPVIFVKHNIACLVDMQQRRSMKPKICQSFMRQWDVTISALVVRKCINVSKETDNAVLCLAQECRFSLCNLLPF
jgi:hypothetical protein